jgi:hypothetical protein
MRAMTHGYDGSQVLFRQAKARWSAARRFARQAGEEEAAGGNGMERRQRERDAVIATLILAQGAAEGYANWVHIQAGIPAKGSWVERWKNLPAAARALGRPAQAEADGQLTEATLSSAHEEFLNQLGAWRNFLLHADARARDRLHEQLSENGDLAPGEHEITLLTADLAEKTLIRSDEIFRWAQRLTAVQAPFLDHAWVAADEC